MFKIIFVVILASSFTSLRAQKKDSFIIEAIPVYDMEGNVYRRIQYYDHPPTAQDSLLFDEYIRKNKLDIPSMKTYSKPKVKSKLKPKIKQKTQKGSPF